MYKLAEHRLQRLLDSGQKHILDGRQIGVEKESLRVSPEGRISPLMHPCSLGSALTNPYITTDYSEALMEFITPPSEHIEDVLAFLRDTQTFVYDKLDDEILWATSMPCVVAGETSIPLAQYGSSNVGQMKTVYRRGLGYRYGRVMQVIAGVHFNYSFPDSFWQLYQQIEENTDPLQDFISEQYFALIRNLQRFGWLVPYLFGASPAVCKSFLGDKSSDLDEFDVNTYYEPYATSLRMGDIGYQNNKENEIGIKACYRNLDAYVNSLSFAIETPCKEYERFGVKVDDEYRQLNANILQIENEYYSTVRPKQILQGNEKPSLALRKRGVRYVELRSLDVNAFEPLGVSETQLRFLEAFMLFCLLNESEQICFSEREEIDQNELDVAHKGRQPGLKLKRDASDCSLKEWALEICDVMQGVCEYLDLARDSQLYSQSLKEQIEKIKDPELTPSSRMLNEMRERKEGFYYFAKRMSQNHYEYFKSINLSEDKKRFFSEAAEASLKKQQIIESEDSMTFDDYLKAYFSQS
ncbi:MAG: glutamate--cysteine ligase [Gammaproteobacteria bacterium]|nr:glutamate--cysteine ligase [Gammaproteobacteria bacterium]